MGCGCCESEETLKKEDCNCGEPDCDCGEPECDCEGEESGCGCCEE